ncbi:MAG: biopolymer transporter ExbD [Bacteroidetes bacterium]|nr:biopolymer transporter ExbD [Bacteroidota bacterium]
MNFRKQNKFSAEVSTSAMNDIMFFLMLFFLIISTLLNPNVIKLTLPNSKNNQAIHHKEIVLSITKDLQYFIDNKPVQQTELESVIQQNISKSPDATIILRCDNSLTVQDLVNVLQIGNKLKVKMILATKTPNGTASNK